MISCDPCQPMHFQWPLHLQMHVFRPHQPGDNGGRDYIHGHLGLLKSHLGLQAGFQFIRSAPHSTKEVQLNLSVQGQHLKQTEGQFMSF